MSAKYYVKNENGEVFSCDGKTRFKILVGSDAHAFLQTEEGKNKYFCTYRVENGETVAIECTREQYVEFNKERYRKKYLEKKEKECGFEVVSGNILVKSADSEFELLETIEDENADIEDIYDRQEMIEKIIEALESLSKEERDLITELYLSTNPKSEREYAEKIGITQPTVNYRKMRILEKIKNFL